MSEDRFLIGLGDVVDRLSIVNIKISILETKVKDKRFSDEEAGKAARLIRELNQERIAVRNALNKKFGSGFEDIKIEYTILLEKEDSACSGA